MSKVFINQYFFIYPKGNSTILWDYHHHKQYEIDSDHLNRLNYLINNCNTPIDENSEIDQNLINLKIISKTEGAIFTAPNWGWDEISKIFHYGTLNIERPTIPRSKEEWTKEYFSLSNEVAERPIPLLKHERDTSRLRKITLPNPQHSVIDLTSCLESRVTVREFKKEKIDVSIIANVLYYAFGYSKEREPSVDPIISKILRKRRTSPSGGGLNSLDAYVYLSETPSIKAGFYYYDPSQHCLVDVGGKEEFSAGKLFEGQHFFESIPFGVFITCRFDRLWWKYAHSRAYRVALLEAGHLAQTFQLMATANGLKTWVSAAFNESIAKETCNLDEEFEYPLIFTAAGYSDGLTFNRELRDMYLSAEGNNTENLK